MTSNYVTREDLKETLSEIFDERRAVEAELHAKHHAWIDRQMEKDMEQIEFWKAMRKGAAQWMMIGILSALATKFFTGHWPLT